MVYLPDIQSPKIMGNNLFLVQYIYLSFHWETKNINKDQNKRHVIGKRYIDLLQKERDEERERDKARGLKKELRCIMYIYQLPLRNVTLYSANMY